MRATIHPGQLSGTVQPPPSKSVSQRALALALLRGGSTLLHNVGASDDEKTAIQIIRALGAQVSEKAQGTWAVTSSGINPVADHITFNESGLSARMFTPVCALSERPLRLSGRGSLLQRPMHLFDQILPTLKVAFSSNAGRLPFDLQGPLLPQDLSVDGSQSSQYSTGLCLAFAYACTEKTTLRLQGQVSVSYLEMTLTMLRQFGFTNYTTSDESVITFTPREQSDPDPFTYMIESDWSNAAFLLAAALHHPQLQVTGLQENPMQGDAVIAALIDTLKTREGGFEFDATHTPDLFPPLAYLAATGAEPAVIKGTHRLIHKESNRLNSITNILTAFGVNYTVSDDLLMIYPAERITAARVHAHHDHRIAMLAALFALQADGKTVIENAEAVSKSYPAFWQALIQAGADIVLDDQK